LKRSGAAAIVLIAATLLAVGCTRIAKPEGWAAPVQTDSILLATVKVGELTAIDLAAGKPLWTFPLKDDNLKLEGLYGDPIVVNDKVYFGAYNGDFFALDLASGREVWPRLETGGVIVGGAAIADGTVFVGSGDGNLYTLDAETGERRWTFDAGDEIWSTPVVSEGVVYFTSMGGKVYALDAKTGGEKWTQPFEVSAAIASTPSLSQGRLFVGAFDSTLYALDAASGQEVWSFKANNWFWGEPLVDGKAVFAGDLDGKVHALNFADGTPLWKQPFQALAAVRAAPTVALGVLVLADHDGNVYGVDPGSGQEKWSFTLGSGALADLKKAEFEGSTVVYVSTRDGDVERVSPADGNHTSVTALALPVATPATPSPTATAQGSPVPATPTP
jgi:outer membrane protein assembly factor BamB